MKGLVPPVILIVEDEPKIARLVDDYLRAASYATHWLADGADAVDWIRDHLPALVLLDLMLPVKDGMTICREVRAFSDLPIIMLTARVEEIDRLLGLELGADDYVCKPFSPRELVARVRAVLRRVETSAASGTGVVYAGISIDDKRHRATAADRVLDLTPVEFRLLRALIAQPGRVFSRDQLLGHAYTDRRVVGDRTVDSHVKNLRRKLRAAIPDRELLRSVYGVGYKIE